MTVTDTGRVVCPRCGRKTQQRILPETQARRLPVYCKHCRSETIVDIQPAPASAPEPQGQSQHQRQS